MPLISDSDLALAREIHRSLLPRDYVSPRLEIAVRYREADRLGGDYATVQPNSNGNIFLAMCDACGHGIASTLLAARVSSFVRDHAEQNRDLCELAESLNRFIFDNFYLSGAFATFLAAEIRPDLQEVLFNNWAQPPGLLYHAQSETFKRVGAQRLAMGMMREFRQDCTIALPARRPSHFLHGRYNRSAKLCRGAVRNREATGISPHGPCFALQCGSSENYFGAS
jgi:serine phosphatase RsbU (regulator of sigma subunit)